MTVLRLFPAIVVLALPAGAASAGPAEICAKAGTSDIVRPFGSGRYYRCLDHKVLVCSIGANLPCARINTSRRNPGAEAFCRENPGATEVPMVATGHDALYTYSCRGSRAVAKGNAWQLDARGFARGLWKPLN